MTSVCDNNELLIKALIDLSIKPLLDYKNIELGYFSFISRFIFALLSYT